MQIDQEDASGSHILLTRAWDAASAPLRAPTSGVWVFDTRSRVWANPWPDSTAADKACATGSCLSAQAAAPLSDDLLLESGPVGVAGSKFVPCARCASLLLVELRCTIKHSWSAHAHVAVKIAGLSAPWSVSLLARTLASRLASCRFDAAATVWNDTLIVHGGYQAAGLSVASSAAFDLRLVLDVYLANAMATCASIRIAASIIALGSWLPDALACSGTAGSQAGHSLAVATGPHNGTLLIVGSYLEDSVEVRSFRAPLSDKVSRAWWSTAACLSGCSCRKHSLRQASSCAAGLLPTTHTMPQGLSICA